MLPSICLSPILPGSGNSISPTFWVTTLATVMEDPTFSPPLTSRGTTQSELPGELKAWIFLLPGVCKQLSKNNIHVYRAYTCDCMCHEGICVCIMQTVYVPLSICGHEYVCVRACAQTVCTWFFGAHLYKENHGTETERHIGCSKASPSLRIPVRGGIGAHCGLFPGL